jgi:hypothetical protein
MNSGPLRSGGLMPGNGSSLREDESTGHKRKANRQACKPCRQAKASRKYFYRMMKSL